MLIAGIIFLTSAAIAGKFISILLVIPCGVLSFAGLLFVHPYQEAAQAAFYRDISTPLYQDPYTENQNVF